MTVQAAKCPISSCPASLPTVSTHPAAGIHLLAPEGYYLISFICSTFVGLDKLGAYAPNSNKSFQMRCLNEMQV